MKDTKMEFSFSEERIALEGEYTVDEVYSLLDHEMSLEGLTASAKGVYEGNYEEDFSKFAEIGVVLLGLKWFRRYCIHWEYTNPEEGLDDGYKHMKESNLCL